MLGEPGDYGDRHARVYDRIYGQRFATERAVTALAEAVGGGRLLELGVGTGRLAIPLAARGVTVDGIDASPAMIALLQARAGSHPIRVFEADLADFDLPFKDYGVAVCAVSTLYMLLDRAAQAGLFARAARHLGVNGQLFIEAFRVDVKRFDERGLRVEHRPCAHGERHVVRSCHHPKTASITVTHDLSTAHDTDTYEVTLHYASDAELDAMAAAAGLMLAARWGDWTRRPATEADRDPVSVYIHADCSLAR